MAFPALGKASLSFFSSKRTVYKEVLPLEVDVRSDKPLEGVHKPVLSLQYRPLYHSRPNPDIRNLPLVPLIQILTPTAQRW